MGGSQSKPSSANSGINNQATAHSPTGLAPHSLPIAINTAGKSGTQTSSPVGPKSSSSSSASTLTPTHDWRRPFTVRFMLTLPAPETPWSHQQQYPEITSLKAVENIVIDTISWNNTHIICCDSRGRTLVWQLINPETRKPRCLHKIESSNLSNATYVECYDATKEGFITTIITGYADNTISIWNIGNQQCITVSLHSFQKNTTGILYLKAIDDEVFIISRCNATYTIDNITGSQKSSYNIVGEPTCCCVGDNNHIFLGNTKMQVLEIKLLDKCKSSVIAQHYHEITCIYAIDDIVISGDADGNIKITLTNGMSMLQLERSAPVTALIATSKVIISGHSDGGIKIWDQVTGELFQTIRAHSLNVTCLDIDEDGEIISGSHDGSIKVWSNIKRASLQSHQLSF